MAQVISQYSVTLSVALLLAMSETIARKGSVSAADLEVANGKGGWGIWRKAPQGYQHGSGAGGRSTGTVQEGMVSQGNRHKMECVVSSTTEGSQERSRVEDENVDSGHHSTMVGQDIKGETMDYDEDERMIAMVGQAYQEAQAAINTEVGGSEVEEGSAEDGVKEEIRREMMEMMDSMFQKMMERMDGFSRGESVGRHMEEKGGERGWPEAPYWEGSIGRETFS